MRVSLLSQCNLKNEWLVLQERVWFVVLVVSKYSWVDYVKGWEASGL